MPGEKTDTGAVLRRLLNTDSIDRFFKQYEESGLPSFGEYVSGLCAERGVSAESVIKKADIHRTYGHKFFNGERIPSRDKVIQLALGFEMDYEQTQKLLAIARESPLHPKVKRDAAIIYALKEGLSLPDVQAMLFDLGVPALGREKQ